MIRKTLPPLILASKSPRRSQLLSDLGLEFQTLVRPVEEIVPPGMGPAEAAEHLAKIKSSAYEDLSDSNLIITSDTIVAVGEEMLGKPKDAAEGREMLNKLSNRDHSVISGVCFQHKGKYHTFHETTKVFFRELSPMIIDHYLEKYQPYDKAGAYGIQEWIGMVGIPRIEGDFYNVMGLPVQRLWVELESWKVLS